MADDRQVYPIGVPREHVTTGYKCWCHPRFEMVCPECGDEPDEVKASCWRCGGQGTIECEDPEAYDGPFGILVIHNDPNDEARDLPILVEGD